MKIQIDKINYFWNSLFSWYEANKRSYPWRKTYNPFYILVAEFLLQQTNVRKVENVYYEIIKKYSTPKDLAYANEDDLKEILEPLGLLYRAERMINTSKVLMEDYDSDVPDRQSELLNLSGVGPYIANAVLCYGYNKKVVPVDTNVIRLFQRYFGLTSNKQRPRNDSELKNKINDLYNIDNYRKANLAVLDFASAVCKAKKYDCNICSLKNKCSFY